MRLNLVQRLSFYKAVVMSERAESLQVVGLNEDYQLYDICILMVTFLYLDVSNTISDITNCI